MTTSVTVTLDGVCTGGDHAHLSVSVQGGAAKQFTILVDDVLGGLDWTDAREQLTTILKLHFRGRTKAQASAEMLAGPLELVI